MCKNGGVANSILGLLVINVTANNSIKITPTDDETKDNSTLVNALDIVADP